MAEKWVCRMFVWEQPRKSCWCQVLGKQGLSLPAVNRVLQWLPNCDSQALDGAVILGDSRPEIPEMSGSQGSAVVSV